jgi:hypothetical protein
MPGSICWGRNSGTGAAAGEAVLMGSDVIAEAAGTATSNAEYGLGIALENNAGTYLASGDAAYYIQAFSTED